MSRLIFAFFLILMLAACQSGGDGVIEATPAIITWQRDPYHIVFRAETVGGENADALFRLNDVPLCTVYGDGRVVWLEETGSGSDTAVIFDVLDEERMESFISLLAVEGRLLTYQEGYALEVPASVPPVYEKLTLAVNDVVHVTDAFGGWPEDYFNIVLNWCKTAGSTPRRFEPEGAWLSATPIEYDTSRPSIYWDPAASGLEFGDVVMEKRWIEGDIVKILWNVMRENPADIQFTQDFISFQIALQVPGVTIDAPPAPQS